MIVQDKLVLITGSNRGIGLALAKEAHRLGARVLMAMRQTDGFTQDWFDDRVNLLILDMSSQESINQFMQNSLLSDVDILINNAGQLTGGILEDQKVTDIYSMFQVNLVGLIHLTKLMLPLLVKRPSAMIINNSSVSGIMHLPCTTTYTAAKTGVVAFSSSLRQDLKGTNINVLTLITPGVKTRMFDEIAPKYSKHMDVSALSTITPERYAQRVFKAIKNKQAILLPTGAERVGVFIAQHFPLLFEKIASTHFKR